MSLDSKISKNTYPQALASKNSGFFKKKQTHRSSLAA